MDKTTHPEAPSLTGYTLYPDAGDFAGLDTPAVSESAADTPPPHLSLPVSPQAVPSPPHESLPLTSVSAPPVSSQPASVSAVPRRRPLSPLRLLLHTILFLFAIFAAAVYANLLLSAGNTLLSEGIGRLAVQSVFGSTNTVTALPASLPPADTVPDTEVPLPDTSASAETTAPAATELPSPLPVTDILTRDLSSRAENGLGLINETPYTPDLSALAALPPVIDSYSALESIYGKNCPAVLILHTHGTEAFQDQAEAGYHTAEARRNICTVGAALAETLTEAGIGTIHCTDLFDTPSFDMAYYNAARCIRRTLEENPSIRYILDIHRDAITTEDGTGIRPLSTEAGIEYAQMMFVVGTDHGGSGHTGWETNLALAARLQSAIHKDHPTLMRDINLRSASFNAQYAPGALLVEAGAACSDMEEAIRSIRILGEALAEEILGE